MSSAVDKLQRELDAAHQELETMRRALAAAEAKNAEHRLAVEEFEVTCKKIEQAHQEWISALDVVKDPIFMHDKDFRILRCNRAYQQRADMPFEQIIGQRYYDVFPKTHAPVVTCREAKAQSIEEGEVRVDGRIYCAHSYPVTDDEGTHRHTVLTLEDITDRKHIEDSLLGSAVFTRAILDNLPIGIAVNSIQPSVAFSYMNDNFPRLYRTTREQLSVPNAFWDVVYEDPEFREKLRKRVLEDYLSGDAERMIWNEIPIIRNGEETTYISARNVLMSDKEHVISMVWDVTGIKNAELALRESEEKFRALVESTSDWIWEVDHQGRYTYVSPRVESLLGYRSDELVGKSPLDLMPPDEAQRVGAQFKDLINQRQPIVDLENLNLCKDGRLKTLETSGVPFFDEEGNFAGYRGIDRDITERKHTREMLIESNDLLQSVIENIPIRVFWKDAHLRYLGCNTAFAHDAGYSTTEEVIGKDDFQMVWREQAELYRDDDQQILDSGMPKVGYEEPQTTPDGQTIWLRTSKVPLRATDEKVIGMLGIYDDITEHKHAEQILKDEKAFSEALIKGLPDIFYLLDRNGCFLQWNARLVELLGLSPEEMPTANAFASVHDDDRAQVERKLQEAFESGAASIEARLLLTNGVRDYLLTATRIKTRYGTNVIGIGLDITERRRAEAKLYESESRLRAILDGVLDGILLADMDTHQLSSGNAAICRMLGYSEEEFSQLTVSDIHPEQDWSYVFDQFQKQANGEVRLATDMPVKRKDGSIFYADINTAPMCIGGRNYLVGIFRDITERKHSAEALGRANRALKTLSAGNLALVHAETEHDLLMTICRILVEIGGYYMAWVGTAEHNAAQTVRPVAQFGDETSYVARAKITWADTERGQGPTGTAIRTNDIVLNQDILNNPKMKPWRKAAIAQGYQSSIAFPLVVLNSLWGALNIYSDQPFAFIDEEVELLKELAGDLAYGIETLRTRAEHEQHSVILRRSLEQSIETIAATVESRDPYTAGHQRRVGELAVAIARAMGLSEDKIQGLHLAAIIHDLGKIHIPAEILAKPGKLTNIEFELIKTHPQAGYDILKNVEFPWPIADIVWQHHEKLDGSGYPQGLKGDQILLESKILTVADIVEAMSSHRPYRSTLGIKSALEEIARGRGVKYDPVVVDTCLMLFAEKKFKFSKR